MRRTLWLLAIGSCAQGDSAACRLDSLARADVREQMPDNCGAFSLDGDGGFNDASMQEAHDCVLGAVAAGRAFTLFYDVWDSYRHVRGGFTGAIDGGGKLHTKSYAYVGDSLGGSFDPRPVLTVQSCGGLVDSGCTPSAGRPCLRCDQPGTPTTICRY